MSKPPFVMSKYASREALLSDALSYYKKECEVLKEQMERAAIACSQGSSQIARDILLAAIERSNSAN